MNSYSNSSILILHQSVTIIAHRCCADEVDADFLKLHPDIFFLFFWGIKVFIHAFIFLISFFCIYPPLYCWKSSFFFYLYFLQTCSMYQDAQWNPHVWTHQISYSKLPTATSCYRMVEVKTCRMMVDLLKMIWLENDKCNFKSAFMTYISHMSHYDQGNLG